MEKINELVSYYGQLLSQPSALLTALIIASAILGLLYCFFGYRLVRVLAALLGFCIGFFIGLIVSGVMGLSSPADLIVPAVIGALLAGIGYFLVKVGVFVAVFSAVFSVVSSLLQSYVRLDEEIVMLVALAAALVLAIMAVIFLRPVVIIATAFVGGLMFADELFEYLIQVRWDPQLEMLVRLGTGLVLGLIGMIFQFVSTRKSK